MFQFSGHFICLLSIWEGASATKEPYWTAQIYIPAPRAVLTDSSSICCFSKGPILRHCLLNLHLKILRWSSAVQGCSRSICLKHTDLSSGVLQKEQMNRGQGGLGNVSQESHAGTVTVGCVLWRSCLFPAKAAMAVLLCGPTQGLPGARGWLCSLDLQGRISHSLPCLQHWG